MVLAATGDPGISRAGLLLLRPLLRGRTLTARPGASLSKPTERAGRRIPLRRDGGWDLLLRRWRRGGDVLQFATTPATENPGRGEGRAHRLVTAAEETEHPLHGGSRPPPGAPRPTPPGRG